MLFDTLLKDKKNYPHLAFLTQGDYELLLNTEDSFIVHFTNNNVFIAETNCILPVNITDSQSSEDTNNFLNVLLKIQPSLLETTNEALYTLIRKRYATSYGCLQYYLGDLGLYDEKLILLKKEDLDFAIENYEDAVYLKYLFSENRVLGYYEDNKLIGYIVRHVDGTLGALYVSEEYRCKGYGSIITRAAVAYFNDPLTYSQVIDNNMASIQMHNRMNATKCSVKIYWMYDTGFSF